MSNEVFGWYPDTGSEMTCKPIVQQTKFGDGYEARISVGINSMPQKWSLSFDRDRETVLIVLSFLEAMKGTESFKWTTPHGKPGTYVCREWGTTQSQGCLRLMCSFEQVFEF